MQLTKTLKVTPEELFDALAGSIMQDIENATGKHPSRNKLNGYKYEKRAQSAKGKAKGTAIKVKIKHFDYPCLYEVRFQYAAGINTMRYEAAPAGDGACELTYTEDFQGVGGNTSARAASSASSSMSTSSRATPTRRLIKSSNTSRVSAA